MSRNHLRGLSIVLIVLLLISMVSPVYADSIPFTDVPASSWYYTPVCWAYSVGAVSGTSATTFSPSMSCTRAQIVTILWGLADRPVMECENPFTDVSKSNYYYNAVLWAKERGVTAGTSATTFSPDASCSRAQAMTFIWRYFGAETCAPEVQYTDVSSNTYYYNAVNWAFSNGITAGTGGNLFSPNATVTRAMVVAFLYRMRHVLEGGRHEFVLQSEHEPTCTEGAAKVYVCSCGNNKTIYSGSALGHDFCRAKLIADATASSPTIYQLICSRCGRADSKGNRRLGKPIFGQPLIQSKIATHAWTADELARGIHFTGDNGAEATITRKWFANAWCYITHIKLPKGAYSSFTGTNVIIQNGANRGYLPAHKEMAKIPEAQILFNGDAQLFTDGATLRAGVPYKTSTIWSATYWNPKLGTYGTVRSIGLPDAREFSVLKGLGVTDTFAFRLPTIEDSRMNMEFFESEPDLDPGSYTRLNERRQRCAFGFLTEGDTVHIFHVVADGCGYTNTGASNPYLYANDRASYGNSYREMMILLSTLGVDFASDLDGGWSGSLIIRRNGVIEQVNASDYSAKTGFTAINARELWDFLYFK